MTDLESEYLQKLEKRIIEVGVSDDFLISLLKIPETYLGLKRISKFAGKNNKTTQGLRRYHKDKIIKICDYQLIIDNE